MAIGYLIEPGTTAATSSDIVLADNANMTIGLAGPDGDNAPMAALIKVQMKGPSDIYYDVGELSGSGQRGTVLSGPGTYRLSRAAGVACGAFQGA